MAIASTPCKELNPEQPPSPLGRARRPPLLPRAGLRRGNAHATVVAGSNRPGQGDLLNLDDRDGLHGGFPLMRGLGLCQLTRLVSGSPSLLIVPERWYDLVHS